MPVTVPVGYETDGAQLDREMTADARRAGSRAGKAGGEGFSKGFRSLVKPLAGIGAAIGVRDVLRDSLSEARESQKVGALTTQVIKSTGGAAKVTADQVGNLATSISNKIGVDDEAIQSGENLLLTFTQIRNEAGKGNDIFNQATQATTDLAAALAAASGGQLNFRSSATLVGKALNDPVKGITALTRVGASFTAQQKAQIKALVEGGDANAAIALNLVGSTAAYNAVLKENKGDIQATADVLTKGLSPAQKKLFDHYSEGNHSLEAQKTILKELNREYGGAAASQATASDKARVAVKNLEEQLGTALLPVVDDLANKVTNDLVPAASEFITEFQDGTGAGGQFRDELKSVVPLVKGLASEAVTLGHALSPVLSLLNSFPAPLKTIGLSSGVLGSQLGKLRTPLDENATKFEKLGRAGANLAGGAGLLLVADSADRAGTALGALESTAGGALAGLAVGGPIGAAVGGLAGLLTSVYGSGHQAAQGISVADQAAQDAKQNMDGLSDSITDVTKGYDTLAKQQVGKAITDQLGGAQQASQVLGSLGLSIQDVTAAALGNQAAIVKVSGAIDGAKQAIVDGVPLTDKLGNSYLGVTDAMREASGNAGSLSLALKNVSGAAKDERAEAILAQLQTKAFGDALKSIPPDTIVKIGTEGKQDAINDIAELSNRGKGLTDQQVRLLLKTAGLPAAKGDIDFLRSYANGLDGKTVTVTLLTSFKRKDALGLGTLPNTYSGGPVRAGEPRIVGERRAEVFVPDRDGRIVPSVQQYANENSSGSSPITIIQNDYGPTTSRAKINEMQWALRFGTRAVHGREAAFSG